jgi:peptidoglycan/xylan/chitin deacetylase (PgdA/CDA1 family)
VLGHVAALEVELAARLADIEPPACVDKLVLALRYDGARVGSVELPVFDGRVPAAVVADAAANAAAWRVLGRFFERTVYPADATPGRHEEVGWLTFLRELWGDPSAAEADFYRGPGARGIATRALARVRRRLSGTRMHEVEISAPLPAVRGPVDALLQAGGVPLGILEVSAPGRVQASELRGLVTYALGMELVRATVREALLGRPPGEPPLRERLARSSRERTSRVGEPPAGSLVLGRRAPHELDSSAARRAALPAEAADELRALARACGEPVEDGAAAGAPVAVAYAPERLPRAAAARRGSAGRRPGTDASGDRRAGSVPILMYHRVAVTGASAAARWRVTPDQLGEHLGLLASRGCRSISLEGWHDAVRKREPVPAGSVCITFDDAYADFAEEAWPLLKRHGFGAHLFVVTGEAGGWNRWDAGVGERVPLLGWDELAVLRDEGVSMGAHSVSHPALGSLSPVDVVRELAGSRTELRERLGVDARAFAYPYGDHDPSVAHLAGACGFRQAVTCRPWPSALSDDPLELPRIEVANTTSVDDLAAALD